MLELLLAGGWTLSAPCYSWCRPPRKTNLDMDRKDLRAFFDFNSMHMGAVNGPAGIVSSDGFAARNLTVTRPAPGTLCHYQRQVDHLRLRSFQVSGTISRMKWSRKASRRPVRADGDDTRGGRIPCIPRTDDDSVPPSV